MDRLVLCLVLVKLKIIVLGFNIELFDLEYMEMFFDIVLLCIW